MQDIIGKVQRDLEVRYITFTNGENNLIMTDAFEILVAAIFTNNSAVKLNIFFFRIGRRQVVILTLPALIILRIVVAFSPNYIMYAVGIFILNGLALGGYTAAHVLCK